MRRKKKTLKKKPARGQIDRDRCGVGGREGGADKKKGGDRVRWKKKHGEGELIVKYEIVLQKARY